MAAKIAKTALIRRRIRREVQSRKRVQNPSTEMVILAGAVFAALLLLYFFDPKPFPQASFNAIRKTDGKGDKDRYVLVYPNTRDALVVTSDGEVWTADSTKELDFSSVSAFDPFYKQRDRKHQFEGASTAFFPLQLINPDLRDKKAVNFALMRMPYKYDAPIASAQVLKLAYVDGIPVAVTANIGYDETKAIIKGLHPTWKLVPEV